MSKVTKYTARQIYDILHCGLKQISILLIGDFILDRYIFGTVERISPEAPVPIVHVTNKKCVAGGAGNAVANLVGLGVKLIAFGNIGRDEAGKELLALESMRKINSTFMCSAAPTIVKTRILGSTYQQMLRLDEEILFNFSEDEEAKVIQNIEKSIRDVDLVLISDYGKGFCSENLCRMVINLAKKEKKLVCIDPKKTDWSCYSNANLVSPNLKELSQAVKRTVANEDKEVEKAARELCKKYNIDSVLVTRSQKGASIVNKDSVCHVPISKAAEVFDVSGAGDTMIAVVASLLAYGMDLNLATEIANIACQIVITHAGTYAISKEELSQRFFEPSFDDIEIQKQYVLSQVALWKSAGEKIVFTNGCFDILHQGHIDSITKAKSLGDKLVVGLNSDASVRRLKGDSRPVNSQIARAMLLSSMKDVDAIVIFEEDTPYEILSKVLPDVLVKGGDYKPDEVIGKEFAKEVVIVPLTEGFSTTRIIEKVQG